VARLETLTTCGLAEVALSNATVMRQWGELTAERDEAREALRPMLAAASGLSFGTDWNNGTHAKLHGYRQKLIDAIPRARQALGEAP